MESYTSMRNPQVGKVFVTAVPRIFSLSMASFSRVEARFDHLLIRRIRTPTQRIQGPGICQYVESGFRYIRHRDRDGIVSRDS